MMKGGTSGGLERMKIILIIVNIDEKLIFMSSRPIEIFLNKKISSKFPIFFRLIFNFSKSR